MEKSATPSVEYPGRKIREDNRLYPIYTVPYGTKSNAFQVSTNGTVPSGGNLLGYTYKEGYEAGVPLMYSLKSAIADYFSTTTGTENSYFVQNKGYGTGSVAGYAAEKLNPLATKIVYRLYNPSTGNHKISLSASESGYVLDTSSSGSEVCCLME
jgi:hypothetical protein